MQHWRRWLWLCSVLTLQTQAACWARCRSSGRPARADRCCRCEHQRSCGRNIEGCRQLLAGSQGPRTRRGAHAGRVYPPLQRRQAGCWYPPSSVLTWPLPLGPTVCRPLQEVASGWGGYPLLQQQDLFGAVQAAVGAGDWDQIEEKLEVALSLASLF